MSRKLETAADLILAEAHGAVSFWDDVSGDPEIAGKAACEVLSAWSHLHRLPQTPDCEEAVARLTRLIEANPRIVSLAAGMKVEPEQLATALSELEVQWGERGMEDSVDDLVAAAEVLFDRYDRIALTHVGVMAFAGDDIQAMVRTQHEEVERTEAIIDANINAFLPARNLVQGFLRVYRDIGAMPDELARITEKYLLVVLEHRKGDPGSYDDATISIPAATSVVVSLDDFRRRPPDLREQPAAAASSFLDPDEVDVGTIYELPVAEFGDGRLLASRAEDGVSLVFVHADKLPPPVVISLNEDDSVRGSHAWDELQGQEGAYALRAPVKWKNGRVILRIGLDFQLTVRQ